jgi:predicted branched-subunit amino acid permease
MRGVGGQSSAARRARLRGMKAILQATLAAILSGILVGVLLKKKVVDATSRP